MRIDRILRDFGCVLLGLRFYREKDARDRVECLRCVIQKQAFRGAMACFLWRDVRIPGTWFLAPFPDRK